VILPDVNVLIYAFRNDSPHHAVCKPWLEGIVNGDALFGVSPVALSAVVRITTDSRIFKQSDAIQAALAYCNAILGKPNCAIVQPGARHWSIFERLCTETDTRGPRVTDAWFAALAIEHGCTWITYDRDYARFPGLEWRLPSV
jgi:toxin-antitoxin system PIN domain toxin